LQPGAAGTHRLRQKFVWYALFLVAGSATAHTGAWSLIAKSDDGLIAFYVDSASIVVAGGTRRARVLYDYQQTQQDPDTLVEHRSVVVLASADCQGYRLATMQSTTYAANMAKGKVVVRSLTFPEEELRYVTVSPASGSVDARVVKYLCGTKNGAPAQH
jgi:hypothetical protein